MLVLKDFASPDTEALLRCAAAAASPLETETFDRHLPAAARRARMEARQWDFLAPARAIDRCLDDVFHPQSKPERDRLRRVAVARLALEHFRIVEPLPEKILSLFPDFLHRLAEYLSANSPIDSRAYAEDFFAKDVRYALGVTLPGGALQFDPFDTIGPKLIVREIARSRSLRPAYQYIRSSAWRRWYSEHMDLRAARQFTPTGWTDHCLRMAEVLRLNSKVAGIVGAGWFYDPALEEASPAIAYIQRTQTRNGAFLVKLPTEPHHVENALYRSASRTRLYKEGRYTPACYLCAWPRRPLLAWAERTRRDPACGFSGYADREGNPKTGGPGPRRQASPSSTADAA